MELGTVSRIKCPACDSTGSHKIVHTGGDIDHLLCPECRNVGVFGFEMVDGKEDDEKKRKRTFLDHAEVMKRRGSVAMRPYSMKKAYTDGDYLKHQKFGEGYVLAVRVPDKMEVFFADGKKLLVCGPGSKSGASTKKGRSSANEKSKTDRPGDTRKKKGTIKKAKQSSSAYSGDEPVECPICGATIHPYDLSRDPKGKVIGCLQCQ